MNEPHRHLTDEEILRWVDEGDEPRDVRVSEHLERCEACRARTSGIDALVSALAAEPSPIPDAEMAAQRERILAAVMSRPRAPVRRLSRRFWLPAIAAAAIAALLLWAPRGTRSPGTAPIAVTTAADSATLPVIVDATRAAEEVAEAAGEPAVVEELVGSSPTDIMLPDVAAPALDEWSDSAELEREFAGLPSEDREAILTELASVDFINDSQE